MSTIATEIEAEEWLFHEPEDVSNKVVIHYTCSCVDITQNTAMSICGTNDNDGWTTKHPNCTICAEIIESGGSCPRCGIVYEWLEWGWHE